MRLTRVHVEGPLTSEAHQTIRGTAASHIARVLRLRVGDSLTLFDGNGGEYDATINGFGKDVVNVTVNEHRPTERESPLSITLAQGISRGERMDWVVQKATELGVAQIVPVLTERCVVRLDAKQAESKLRHWRGIVIAACEQCGRNRVPEVTIPMTFDEYLRSETSSNTARATFAAPHIAESNAGSSSEASSNAARATSMASNPHFGVPPSQSESTATLSVDCTAGAYRLLLSPTGKLRIRDLTPTSGTVSVLIGPEGGLTELEHELAERAGFVGVRLGPRVLRTETAAIAALAAIQQQLGDL
jgi:16S rRNA (uracil1498-N3)-methyltransferase